MIEIIYSSPMLGIAEYISEDEYFDGSKVSACHTLANTFWSALYFLSSIFLFFIAPLIILIVLYCIIAKNLISNAATIVLNKHIDNYSIRARRQVILMLGTVVLSFFLCLIPFRVFTLWIIIVPEERVNHLDVEKYYNILYFCRIMVYLNSAINPILYNLMSSKFRHGFIICSDTKRKFYFRRTRNGTFISSTTVHSCRSSTAGGGGCSSIGGTLRTNDGGIYYRPRTNSILIKNQSSTSTITSTISDLNHRNNSSNNKLHQKPPAPALLAAVNDCIDEEEDLLRDDRSKIIQQFQINFNQQIIIDNHDDDDNDNIMDLHETYFIKENIQLHQEHSV